MMYCTGTSSTAASDCGTYAGTECGYEYEYLQCSECYEEYEEIAKAAHIHPWMMESARERFRFMPVKVAMLPFNRKLYPNLRAS